MSAVESGAYMQPGGPSAIAACSTLVWGFAIAWIATCFLSSTFFQDSDAVCAATLSSAATASTALALFLIASLLSRKKSRLRNGSDDRPTTSDSLQERNLEQEAGDKHGRPHALAHRSLFLLVAGFLLLAAVTPLSSVLTPALLDGVNGNANNVLYGAAIGAMAGLGLGCLALSSINKLAYGVTLTPQLAAVGTGIGFCLFIALMALVPPENCATAAAVLALVAIAPGLVATSLRQTYGTAHATSPRTHVSNNTCPPRSHGIIGAFAYLDAEAANTRRWQVYVVLSGLLLGYCYNIYPKTTRFAGTAVAPNVSALIGSASTASIMLFFVLATIAIATTLVWHIGPPDKRFFRIGCLAIVCLAAVYFCLPLMPQGVFELLVGMAMLCCAPVALWILYTVSTNSIHPALHCICIWVSGLLAGDILSAAFIELTVPKPGIGVPVSVQTAAIVGAATVGFAALFIVAYAIVGSVYFPDSSGTRLSDDSLNPSEAAATLAAAYGLSTRETEVAAMLLRGRSGPYISEQLGLSKSTVKTHIRHLYAKLGVSSKQELIDLAQESGRPVARPHR